MHMPSRTGPAASGHAPSSGAGQVTPGDFTEAQWTESKRLSKQLCAERGVEAAVDKELDSWREERIWRSSGGKSKRTRCGWGFRFSCL